MRRGWREEKRLQQRANDCHFLLNFSQGSLSKKVDKFTIYERILDIFEIPVAERIVYEVPPEEEKKLESPQEKAHFLQELVKKSPDLIFLSPASPVIAYKNKAQEIMLSNIASVKAYISDKLQFFKEAFQPIVEVARFIATNEGHFLLNFNWTSPDIEGAFIQGFSSPFFIKGSTDFFSSSFSGVLSMKCGDREVVKEIQGFRAYCLWRFLYFILPGLMPHRFAICEVCKRVMYKIRETDKYCSPACSQKAYRMRKKKEQEQKQEQEEGKA